jgi:hypothetical protein
LYFYGSNLAEIIDAIGQYESKPSIVCDRKSEVKKFMVLILEQRALRIAFGNRGEVNADEIRALHLQRRKDRHASDLGFWFFRTCGKVNPDELFVSKREAVVWTVLGAHRRIDTFVCCSCYTYYSS